MNDTIAALATAPGEAALAIIRISGGACRDLVRQALRGAAKSPSPTLRARHAELGLYLTADGKPLDQLVWIYYAAPRSFTGEDMLELMPHGSPFIVQKLLEDLVTRGCRLADPGEFSRRAFLNGKMDLAQAEAIVDIIRARSDQALAIAQQQLSGALGQHVQNLVDELLRVTARLEAYIDFPDEDLPPEDESGPVRQLLELQESIDALMVTQQYRRRLQDGIRVVLVGEPNAGKSSLLNRLVGEDRAIVSEEAGTTRDFIEVRLPIGGHLVRLFDTAGLRESDSQVERAGVVKTLELASQADLLLFVHDLTAEDVRLESGVLEQLGGRAIIHVGNKADQASGKPRSMAQEGLEGQELRVSATTGEGLNELRSALLHFLDRDFRVPADADVAISARHASALKEAKVCIGNCLKMLRAGEAAELPATELHLAIEAMSRIVGRIDNERVLDELFGSFCIGK